MFLSLPPTVNNTTDVYNYYMAKCQSPPIQTLTPPPWSTSLETVIPDYYPSTAKFTFEEVDKVISHLPNNSAIGYDGVTYETIKARKPQSTQILTYLFNTCLINGKVPGSWKGAPIHRKTTFQLTHPHGETSLSFPLSTKSSHGLWKQASSHANKKLT